MHLDASTRVLITGGGSGIGRELALELARHSCRITVVDNNIDGAKNTVRDVESAGGQGLALECDLRNDAAQEAVFQQHMDRFGGLDIACLNAGILEKSNLLVEEGSEWQETLDINLRAQMMGARCAVRAMLSVGSKGVIMFTASASSIWPMPHAPVYAASKAGLLNFANSLAPRLARKGIRVCSLCPQPVNTPMVTAANQNLQALKGTMPKDLSDKLLTTDQVVEGAMYLLRDESKVGTVLILHVSGAAYEWRFSKHSLKQVDISAKGRKQRPTVSREALTAWATRSIPSKRQKVQVHRLSSDFRAATRLVNEPIPALKEGHILIRRMYAGVNASDVNYSSGRYFGSPEESAKLLPFDAGFEAVGVVAAVGPNVIGLKVGDSMAQVSSGTYCEWGLVPVKEALPVPTCAPEIVALLTSGMTASIGLQVVGQMGSGETVLVTAAAGGTGQFVVQLAKAAGNHVIATCGGADKAVLLKQLGADRVINYREESVKDVLQEEYPKGVNLVWESVGGEMFETCVRALSTNGRLIVIGMMSQYGSGWKPSVSKGLLELLLWKSASVRGFFLVSHTRHYRAHLKKLAEAWLQGRLQVSLDPMPFLGVESAVAAVEHLQTGKSVGKVVVQLAKDLPPLPTSSRM